MGLNMQYKGLSYTTAVIAILGVAPWGVFLGGVAKATTELDGKLIKQAEVMVRCTITLGRNSFTVCNSLASSLGLQEGCLKPMPISYTSFVMERNAFRLPHVPQFSCARMVNAHSSLRGLPMFRDSLSGTSWLPRSCTWWPSPPLASLVSSAAATRFSTISWR
eukprot:XP_001697139.1 predicted protein [Chlamydomonas reinhardtii]